MNHTPVRLGAARACPFCDSPLARRATACAQCGAYEHIGLTRNQGAVAVMLAFIIAASIYNLFRLVDRGHEGGLDQALYRGSGLAAVAVTLWLLKRLITARRWYRNH